jgi:site-specific DNA recombinase
MASIAEFYSANPATEIVKGATQKAQTGGTPYQAPIGYLNVREHVDGREIRTVTPDPERARLVELRGIEPLTSSMRPRRSTN